MSVCEVRCETCRFFAELKEQDRQGGDIEGECRRFPPVLNHSVIKSRMDNDPDDEDLCTELAGRDFAWAVPTTYRSFWCGEWASTAEAESRAQDNDGKPIALLNLDTRSKNCLEREDIFTIDDLCRLRERDLLDMRNLGSKSINRIRHSLEKIGRKLKGDQ